MKIYTGCYIIIFTAMAFSGVFTPTLSIGGRAGAARSFLETEGQMEYLLEPTSGVERDTRVNYGLTLDLTIGRYLGFATGFEINNFGQSTPLTSVLLKDDIFDHDFRSSTHIRYFSVPLTIKAGVKRNFFSLFLKGGVMPSVLIKKRVKWEIDGQFVKAPSNRRPNVSFNLTDIPICYGGEAGFHFGKNSIAAVGQYIYGINNIAYGISGSVKVRSYGAKLIYRREITIKRNVTHKRNAESDSTPEKNDPVINKENMDDSTRDKN